MQNWLQRGSTIVTSIYYFSAWFLNAILYHSKMVAEGFWHRDDFEIMAHRQSLISFSLSFHLWNCSNIKLWWQRTPDSCSFSLVLALTLLSRQSSTTHRSNMWSPHKVLLIWIIDTVLVWFNFENCNLVCYARR